MLPIWTNHLKGLFLNAMAAIVMGANSAKVTMASVLCRIALLLHRKSVVLRT